MALKFALILNITAALAFAFDSIIYTIDSDVEDRLGDAERIFGPHYDDGAEVPEAVPSEDETASTRTFTETMTTTATTTTKTSTSSQVVCGSRRTTSQLRRRTAAANSTKLYNHVLPDSETNDVDDEQIDAAALRIVGGQQAVVDDWPWQVSIRRFGHHICGGTLLNRHYVLTAAHCFNEMKQPRFYTVYIGKSTIDAAEPGECSRKVYKIIIHSKYNKTMENDNDIALIRLLRAINYSPKATPICLPQTNETIKRGSSCYVTGFGETRGTGSEGHLKEVKVPIVSDKLCKSLQPQLASGFSKNMFCAGRLEGGADSCQGDSGGPLVCENRRRYRDRFVLYGLVSWGWDCGKPNSPGFYIKVANYIPWIVANLNR